MPSIKIRFSRSDQVEQAGIGNIVLANICNYKKNHYISCLLFFVLFNYNYPFRHYVCFSYHYVPSSVCRRTPEIFSSDFFWSEGISRHKRTHESRDPLPYRRCILSAVTHPWDDDRLRASDISMSMWEPVWKWWCDCKFLWELWNNIWCSCEAHNSLYLQYDLCTDEVL